MLDRCLTLLPDLRLLRACAMGGAFLGLAACGGEPTVAPMPMGDAGVMAPADGGMPSPMEEDAGPSEPVHTVAVQANPVVLLGGGTASLELAITRSAGFADPLAITIDGLPEGVTATGPDLVDSDVATFTLTADPLAPRGEHAITIRVGSGDVMAEAETYLAIPAEGGTLDVELDGTPLTGVSSLEKIVVLPNGSVVTAWARSGERSSFVVARWRRDGSLDTTFDADGVAEHTFDFMINADSATVDSVVVRTDGTVIVLANADVGVVSRSWLIAFDDAGQPRAGFGDDGVFELSGGSAVDLALFDDRLFALQWNAASNAWVRSYSAISPDAPLFDTEIPGLAPSEITVDAMGRATVLGNSGMVAALGRLTAEGQIDETFRMGSLTTFGALEQTHPSGLVPRPDGTTLAVGTAASSSTMNPFAALVDDTGRLVTSFGAYMGRMVVDSAPGALRDVTIARDGTMLATGYLTTGGLTLMSILPGGALSLSMGPTGVHVEPTFLRGTALAATTDHRVVVAAYDGTSMHLLRFWY